MSPAKRKRPYSRDFGTTGRKVDLTVSAIPARLRTSARAKAKRERVSLRATLLRWLANWTAGRRPDEDAPSN